MKKMAERTAQMMRKALMQDRNTFDQLVFTVETLLWTIDILQWTGKGRLTGKPVANVGI